MELNIIKPGMNGQALMNVPVTKCYRVLDIFSEQLFQANVGQNGQTDRMNSVAIGAFPFSNLIICSPIVYNMVRSTKKCIPGMFCIENMTLFLTFVLLVTVTYLYYTTIVKATQQVNTVKPITILAPPVQIQPAALATISSHDERPLQSEYAPPLKYENDYAAKTGRQK